MRFLAIKNRSITGRYQQWYLAELFQLSGLTQRNPVSRRRKKPGF